MGFLRKRTEPAAQQRSLADLSEEELKDHLLKSRYGDFRLTDAVRPSLNFVPVEGWRPDSHHNEEVSASSPILIIAASQDKLLRLFWDLSKPLGDTVDVALESSHTTHGGEHMDSYHEELDRAVLESNLMEYDNLLLHDGCTGISLFNPDIGEEVQFDEHKLIIVYAKFLSKYRKILEQYGICQKKGFQVITDHEHVHSSSNEFAAQFKKLQMELGDGELFEDEEQSVM